MTENTFDPEVLKATDADRSHAFEWLRGQALKKGNPDWRLAAVALEEWARLKHAESKYVSRGGKPATVRNNDDGTLDEVFADPCEFHLEQMDDGHWWIGINAPDKFYHINLHSKGRIKAFIEGEQRHESQRISSDAVKS